ncbi:3-phosphoserine/phosphohydroxythreonine transaminase [Alloalcanivorax profundimaris]|uniref:Phosphoserine aminotransferase n=1 Tax=Alloalcanivorax profundimaris TaxID=2735259 RepID=A0ABS0ALT7_9GAMM|nr:3-phosphoserine/phosphohydroxythreonine transaminase [Alloalcanivorax profundimaris]MAO58473.1 3-phosphoserine/phosphohydroxythreonine aminotransferase [Alcanivorax sp.]MBM1144854.1 3-phosphoserine/phosphohydroxythreonine transaminase [Alcanivorax sp. ZXX171]MCQ6261911.1 3-phosphoserine/phosphohydroxythreonine transaminase [Alcanivorax sp. MM125-6]MAY11336.1 3-phosphoserine/phosphohydroxythreonine aminotransferase [Alcanivorax sp.]MBF1800166.1 3-phosphoserine/phosphohydroxythreonine transam|tara:strand:+ start:27111 stop:28190 length:1080 start_codon:yes stop_codon:yes gene_type:complete
MSRAYNFCAGPAALPEAVLQRAREEMLDYRGTGMSVMEMSHRDSVIVDMAEKAERDLRDLLGLSDDYAVLFLQGGASAQFAMVPLNLLGDAGKADYVNTGQWSTKAIKEARRFCEVNVAASSEDANFSYAPAQSEWRLSDDAAYVHYCPNETIGGLEFDFVPEVDKPLVADMSSTILSRPVDVSRFGLIYAGAQKNIGPAGLTLVIVRKDLLGRAGPTVPSMLNYQIHADNGSMYNTPPTFAWYLAGLVFEWLKEQGGVAAMGEINRRKAAKLYDYIDASDFYANPVRPTQRSWMNVPFVLADSALDKDFLAEADAAGLRNLKGHRSVGGMRASIYNAVPEAAVDALIGFMSDFEKRKA